jgi:hypothetical protein
LRVQFNDLQPETISSFPEYSYHERRTHKDFYTTNTADSFCSHHCWWIETSVPHITTLKNCIKFLVYKMWNSSRSPPLPLILRRRTPTVVSLQVDGFAFQFHSAIPYLLLNIHFVSLPINYQLNDDWAWDCRLDACVDSVRPLDQRPLDCAQNFFPVLQGIAPLLFCRCLQFHWLCVPHG